MYDTLVRWIGSKTCTVAGDVGQALDAGHACASGQAGNVGLVVVALLALTVVVMVINARRRQRRDNNYFN
jgi:hypothetical protein